jgi:integrase
MSQLEKSLADYLALRHSLGYKLERPGQLLSQFVAYLDTEGVSTVTVQHALIWAMLPSGADVMWWRLRLSAVRQFATYLHTLDPSVEVPPVDLLPVHSKRATPYLYAEADIAALMRAAGTLRGEYRVATFRTLLGLLVVTGMRIGEAIRMDRADANLTTGALMVRNSKFGKSRELPLHPTTVNALRSYMSRRDRPTWTSDNPALFCTTSGSRLHHVIVTETFHRLLKLAGLEPRSAECRPRIHDFRHTFAVQTVLECYRTNGDVQACLPLLSTYLGHVDPGSTYWYLSAAPELLQLAGQRLERHLGGQS